MANTSHLQSLIEATDLACHFHSIRAVDGVTFSVRRGEVMGFLGPNGAGKSTTMRMITGYLPPTFGAVSVCGWDIQTDPVKAKRRLGYLPEGAPLYGDMTTGDFLHFIATARGLSGADRRRGIDFVIGELALSEVIYQRVETLSKGLKRRVGLAQALVHDPDVVILDEPTDGLDPNQRHQVRELIRRLGREKAIIISTHLLEEVDAVCSRAIVVNRGRIVAAGTPSELHAQARDYNAVVLSVRRRDIDRLKETLTVLEDLEAVEIGSKTGEWVTVTAIPRKGGVIADAVGAAIRERGLDVREFQISVGGLDAVFRRLTTS